MVGGLPILLYVIWGLKGGTSSLATPASGAGPGLLDLKGARAGLQGLMGLESFGLRV